MPAHRTIFFVLVLLGIAGCKNKAEVEAAKHSLFDTDFATVYSAALDATRELYPNLDDAPGHGAIKTAWHQVQFASNDDDMSSQSTVANGMGTPGATPNANAAAAGMPTRLAYKRYFIRFDVSVAGGRPWRLKVIGHAAEWEPGAAMPTELHGIARPPWLDGRTDALTVAIYKRIKPYAIPVKEEVKPEDEVVRTDPGTFKDVPPAAAKVLAGLKDTLAARDMTALRAALADDIVWSLGGGTGADAAMATWQADPEASFDGMTKAIAAPCGGDAHKVTCPAGDPKPGQFQLVLEPRSDAWKITSFVRSE